MVSPAHELKNAATKAHADLVGRVKGPQGGVPTFFDNFFGQLLYRLMTTEATHGWDAQRDMPPAGSGSQASSAPELQWLSRFLDVRARGRFVPYSLRLQEEQNERACDIGNLEMLMSQGTTACLEWKGKPLFKTVFDFALLPMLLWELKPATVFEIGSGAGASAIWMADTLKAFGKSATIYSVDTNAVDEEYEAVHFLVGDCKSPVSLFELDLLRSAPRPWLVLEDAHVNVHDVLVHMDGFLAQGDYLFVEDSRIKVRQLSDFLALRDEHYKVDTRYTDFFGRNATCAANSIFVRT
jgi:cephalosporin hydroxylase